MSKHEFNHFFATTPASNKKLESDSSADFGKNCGLDFFGFIFGLYLELQDLKLILILRLILDVKTLNE